MPRVNRPDAGEQHFRSVRRTHGDLDVTELAPAVLIGPDGRIVEPDLEGAGIASALEAVFGVK